MTTSEERPLVLSLYHTIKLDVSLTTHIPDHLFYDAILHQCRRGPLHEWHVHILCCGDVDGHFG